MLRLILRTGMAANRGFGAINSPEHVAAARKIAQEGIVLLKTTIFSLLFLRIIRRFWW